MKILGEEKKKETMKMPLKNRHLLIAPKNGIKESVIQSMVNHHHFATKPTKL